MLFFWLLRLHFPFDIINSCNIGHIWRNRPILVIRKIMPSASARTSDYGLVIASRSRTVKHACLMHIGDDFSYNRIVMGILTDGEVFFDGDIAGIMTNEAGVCILNFGMDMSKTRMLGDLIDKYRSRMLSKSGKKPQRHRRVPGKSLGHRPEKRRG